MRLLYFAAVVSILFFFFSSSSSFFPRLISAVADWMSTILLHMVCPSCEFRMQVWNVLHAAHWKCRMQKNRQTFAICTPSDNIVELYLRTKACIDNKKLVKQQYLLHISSQYIELRPTSGWDWLTSLGYPGKFQRVLHFGFVTAVTSLNES